MNLLITLAAFIFAVGLLVTIHELGHYAVARWFDVKILRFSIGFGRPLLLWRRGRDQTEWVIGGIPLGGYVRMADERETPLPVGEAHRAFNNKPVWQRIAIVLAGPLANLILAAMLYWGLLVTGMPEVRAIIGSPASGSRAAQAGFENGDEIVAIDGATIQSWNDARWHLLKKAVDHETVRIETESVAGVRHHRVLALSSTRKGEIENDFLDKLGLPLYRVKGDPAIGIVAPESAAARAGLQPGDWIVSINGQAVANWTALVQVINKNPGIPLQLEVRRKGNTFTQTVTPDVVTESGQRVGRLGVGQIEAARLATTVKVAPLAAIGRAWQKVGDLSWFSLQMLGKMVTGQLSLKNLSGPVMMANYAGQTVQQGWIPFVSYLAFISISLGVLNLLPIPVLDGGQLMYYMAEIFKGSPVSERTMEIGQRLGLTLLMCLTAFALYNDLQRLITG